MIVRTINGVGLDSFALAYCDCALWSSTGNNDEPLDRDFDLDDIATETLRQMIKDCSDFNESNRELLDHCGLSFEQQGHDFWLTRNGHGAGFWDRGIGEIGDKLTEQCRPYGSFELYVGDDGKIHGQ